MSDLLVLTLPSKAIQNKAKPLLPPASSALHYTGPPHHCPDLLRTSLPGHDFVSPSVNPLDLPALTTLVTLSLLHLTRTSFCCLWPKSLTDVHALGRAWQGEAHSSIRPSCSFSPVEAPRPCSASDIIFPALKALNHACLIPIPHPLHATSRGSSLQTSPTSVSDSIPTA